MSVKRRFVDDDDGSYVEVRALDTQGRVVLKSDAHDFMVEISLNRATAIELAAEICEAAHSLGDY